MSTPLLDIPMASQFWDNQGANLLSNPGFESGGDPPASWTQLNCLATTQTVARPGATGTKVGQVGYDGVNASGRIYQAAAGAAAGRRYYVQAWGRTDGVGTGRIVPDGSPISLAISASTSWQLQGAPFVAVGANLNLFGDNLAAGRYAQFDDVEFYEQFLYTRNRGLLGTTPATSRVQCGDGRTAATFPTMANLNTTPRQGFTTAAGQYVLSTIPLASGTYTVSMLVQKTSTLGSRYLLDCRDSGGAGFISIDAGGVLGSSSGTLYVNGVASTTLNLGALNHVACSGITLSSPGSMAILSSSTFGISTWLGNCFGFRVDLGSLTSRQIKDVHQRMLSEVWR